MRILYIDTSTSYLYAAIADETNLISSIKKEFGHRLSEEALPQIAELFSSKNISPKEIEKIIVVNGPGSFTGIRIGITIAKIYAWALNIPITTITSLEAMALSTNNSNIHIPMIDARRNYVYIGIYDEDNNELLKPQHIKLEEVIEKLKDYDNYTIISNDELNIKGNIENYNPNILEIIKKYINKEPINPHAVNPSYLKLTEAEEKLNDN